MIQTSTRLPTATVLVVDTCSRLIFNIFSIRIKTPNGQYTLSRYNTQTIDFGYFFDEFQSEKLKHLMTTRAFVRLKFGIPCLFRCVADTKILVLTRR